MRQRRTRLVGRSTAFELEKDEGDGREDGVMVPAGIGTPFEMVPAEFVFEFAILLLDRPAAAGQGHQRLERRRGVQVEQVVLPGLQQNLWVASGSGS